MRRSIMILLFVAASGVTQGPQRAYTLRPLIGSGSRGDGGPAIEALLDGPYGLAEDADGNVYISESNAGVIRRVRPDGVIERFAGSGIIADGQEGQAALETDLLSPTVLVVDRDGGLIFADAGARRIRKVLTDGTIRNLIGTGRAAGFGGGPGGGGPPGLPGGGISRNRPALETEIGTVGGMVLDSSGFLIFTDETNSVIRRLDSDGIVRTIAGTGTAGFGGDGLAVGSHTGTVTVTATDADGSPQTISVTLTLASPPGSAPAVDTLSASSIDSDVGTATLNGRVDPKNLATDAWFEWGTDRSFASFSSTPSQPVSGSTFQPISAVLTGLNSSTVYYFRAAASNSIGTTRGSILNFTTAVQPDFSLSVSPSSQSVFPGSEATYTLSISPSGGFSSPVSLSCTGLPKGANCSFSPNPATSSSTLTVATATSTPTGSHTFTITGSGDWLRRTTSAGLTVSTAASKPVLQVSRTSLSFSATQGGSNPASQSFTITNAGGGTLNWTASTSPSWLLLSATSGTAPSTLTVSVSLAGEPATKALFRSPAGLALDNAGNLYVADGSNCRVRRINSDGSVDTVAGTGTCATASSNFSGGAGTRTSIGRLTGLAYDPSTDSLLVASPGQARVLRLDLANSRVSAFLGNGRIGAVETTAPLQYSIDSPSAVLVSPRAGVLVADSTSFQVLKVQGDTLAPFAGYWPQLDVYPSAATAPLLRPRGLCVDYGGALFVVDAGAERVLSFREPDQLVGVAGARYPTGYSGGGNGPAIKAHVSEPDRVACAPNGDVYLTHGRQISVINREGIIRTVRDYLDDPTGLAIDAEGRLLFSEAGAHKVVRYDPATRTSTVIAGTGTAGFDGDGGAATDALLDTPGDLAFDSQGNLLIADRGNRRVRRVSPSGTIRTIAGSNHAFWHTDTSGQLATAIGLDRIDGLTVDGSGNIYISEYHRVSVVRPDGRIYILAGYLGEDDDGVKSYIHGPMNGCDGLVADGKGWLYFSLRHAGRVMLAAPPEAALP